MVQFLPCSFPEFFSQGAIELQSYHGPLSCRVWPREWRSSNRILLSAEDCLRGDGQRGNIVLMAWSYPFIPANTRLKCCVPWGEGGWSVCRSCCPSLSLNSLILLCLLEIIHGEDRRKCSYPPVLTFCLLPNFLTLGAVHAKNHLLPFRGAVTTYLLASSLF